MANVTQLQFFLFKQITSSRRNFSLMLI